MSFSKSKRFSQALNETLPGPAHYHVNWGSFGLLELTFSRIPGLTEICRKTNEKISPQKMKNTGQLPEQNSSPSGLQRNETIRASSKKRKGEAARKEEMQGQVPEQTKTSRSSGMHRNIFTRESLRKRTEEALRKIEEEPSVQQPIKQVNPSIEKQFLNNASTNDKINKSKSVQRASLGNISLHSLLPVRKDYFREKKTRVLITDLYDSKVTQNSDDEKNKVGCGRRRIMNERNSIGNDDNKENISPSITNITARKLQGMQFSTDDFKENISHSITNITKRNLPKIQFYTDDDKENISPSITNITKRNLQEIQFSTDDDEENITHSITNITERNLQEKQLFTDNEKENILHSSNNISEKKLEEMQSYADNEVLELLKLCIEETDFMKKMDMLQRLSDLQKRENERMAMNLSEIVEEGHIIFNKTL